MCGAAATVEFMIKRGRNEVCGSCGELVDVRPGDIFTFCVPCWELCAVDGEGGVIIPHGALHGLLRRSR
jgi:hypothetical protein